jgi:hypothetical protein
LIWRKAELRAAA